MSEKVNANFATVGQILTTYRAGEGFESYEKLTVPTATSCPARSTPWPRISRQLRGKLGLG